MDDKWRTAACSSCGGFGLVNAPTAWYGFYECKDCGESGTVWLRPKGHAFQYPGGPALGWYSEEAYKKGKPMMPYEWHAWSASDEEIDNFIVDRMGSFDQDLNRVICMCGFGGTLREHQIHAEKMEKQFILEHKNV
jgi:hypothetical protein